MRPCDGVCDHCYPDALHFCSRPDGHRGYHSCEVQNEDYEQSTWDGI